MGPPPIIRFLTDRRKGLYFPNGRWRFIRDYARWQSIVRLGPDANIETGEKLTVILLSYKRPQNIQPIVDAVLRCSFVQKVIVCNNNPEYRIQAWVRISDDRLSLINQLQNMGPEVRFKIARVEKADYFLVIDDDVFLFPEQIRSLFVCLLNDPTVPHGVRGQVVYDQQEFVDGIQGVETRVDILNGVYAFTRSQIEEFFRLCEHVRDITMADDIVLSFSGEATPMCHDVGEILFCPTEGLSGIAVWKELDFLRHRLRVLAKLKQIKPLAPTGVLLSSLPVVNQPTRFSIDLLNEHIVQQERQPIALSWHQPRLSIVGWAIDAAVNERAGAVYIDIDGKLYPAFYGTERKDVADFFNTPAYRYSGFVRVISDLDEGTHSLSLAILTADRKAVYKSAQNIQFEVKELGKWQQYRTLSVKQGTATNGARAVRIHLIRNLFPHWADHSGAHQFTRYLEDQKYSFEQQVVPLGSDQFPVRISSLRNGLRRWVKKNGIHYYDLNNLRAELKAARCCLQGPLDLVHYLDGEYMQYLPIFSKSVRHFLRLPPMVATFHQPPEVLGRVLNKEIVRLLDHVFVYSRLQAGFFEQFMPAAKISLVPHGVDTEFFRPGKREVDGRFRCLTVGFWLRDLEMIWQTAKQLSIYPDIEFHLVTPREEPPGGLTNVKIHKNLDDAGLLGIYQQSDLLCLPLQDSAANNSLLEGAACGLPIVSSRVGGVPEYTNENFARLLPLGNADAFASTILHLQTHVDERKQMGQAARRFAEEHLAWHRVALRMAEVYDGLLSSRN